MADELTPFLQQIARTPLLTPAEELRLARRSSRAIWPPRTRMIEANLRLVVHVAKRFQRAGHGLSLRRPDPGGHARAGPRGREVRPPQGLPLLHLRDDLDPPGDRPRDRRQGPHDPPARAGRPAAADARARGAQARRRARPRRRSRPSSPRPPKRRCPEVIELQQLRRSTVSLDEPVGTEDDGTSLGDLLPDTHHDRPGHQAAGRGRPAGAHASSAARAPGDRDALRPVRREAVDALGDRQGPAAAARATSATWRSWRSGACAPRRSSPPPEARRRRRPARSHSGEGRERARGATRRGSRPRRGTRSRRRRPGSPGRCRARRPGSSSGAARPPEDGLPSTTKSRIAMPVPAIPNHGLQRDGHRADAGHDQRAEQREAEPRAGQAAERLGQQRAAEADDQADAGQRAEAQRQPPAGPERHPEQGRAQVAGDHPADHGVGADQAAVVVGGERVRRWRARPCRAAPRR